jgi:hypothetical protein
VAGVGRIKLRELKLGFRAYDGERRTVYEQLDGNVILADECTCYRDPLFCPIDKHAMEARQNNLREWDKLP